MNISEVNVKLTGNDILSIINEFIKIDGLKIKEVIADNEIIINGSFIKGVKLDFSVQAQILRCENNKITVKLSKAKLLNLGIFRFVRSFILKKISSQFKEYGIESKKDIAVIDVKGILKDISYVDLNINEIYVAGEYICAKANDINISVVGNLIKEFKVEEEKQEEKQEEVDLSSIKKIEDNYSAGREIIAEKLPQNVADYKEYIFILPDIVSLIYRLLKDKRVPLKTKLIMSASIAYLTVPTNIIPDNIPFIGKIDDIGVGFFALNRILTDIPINVVLENWNGKNEILFVLKSGIEYIINFTKADNVERLYCAIEEISTL